MTESWKNKKTKELFRAFLSLKTSKEVADFCRDIMTEKEIEEFAARLEVAKRLYQGKTQREIASETGVSIATVTRVNHWLRRGMDGYTTVLNRLYKFR